MSVTKTADVESLKGAQVLRVIHDPVEWENCFLISHSICHAR